jgi:hypothetical protein
MQLAENVNGARAVWWLQPGNVTGRGSSHSDKMAGDQNVALRVRIWNYCHQSSDSSLCWQWSHVFRIKTLCCWAGRP